MHHLSLPKPASRTPVIIAAVTIALLIFGGIGLHLYRTANAVSTADWKAGRIIDDAVFTNHRTMSAAQIQSFLANKVPSCDTNGQQLSEYGGPDLNGDGKVQRWEWGKHNYNQTTFTCLKNYTQNGKKASQIIYEVAQQYKINPQVLLVLLQKEQGLVNDKWPLNLQYRSATGYGCPDTADCNSDYYGFTNQVTWAAKMFRAIMDNVPQSQWYTPYVLGNNYIQYNPTASCGGSTVNIQNRATQALYNYTPYQPNKAALDAGWGMAHCGAYGNRNFFLYFKDWFGSPISSPVYSYSLVSKEAYSDSAYQTQISNSPTIEPNTSIYLKVTVKNTGNRTWYNDGDFKLGTNSPKDRKSSFVNDTWLGSNRAAPMAENSVEPGGTATFSFKVTAPPHLGTYDESFGVVIEGKRWLSGTITYPIAVASATAYYNVNPVSFKAYSDSAYTKPINTSNISIYTESKIYIKSRIKNTGNRDLPSGITKIATTNPQDRTSVYRDDSWLSTNRVATATGGTIAPGSTGTFEFTLTAPDAVTQKQTEQFGLVIEGQRWLSSDIGSLALETVERPADQIQSGTTLRPGDSLVSGNEKYRLVFQGDGNLVMYNGNKPIWHTRTNGTDSNRVVMQGDGNLVMYNGNKPIWHTRTNGKGSSRLVLQSDRNLVIYRDNGGASWATYTNR